MTDAEYEAQKARVLAVLDLWTPPLGLRWWKLKHVWSRTTETGDHGQLEATCTASWEYLEATIEWFLPTLQAVTDDELEDTVVHELMHVLVNEMSLPGSDGTHEERVVTTLAKAARWTRDFSESGRLRLPASPAKLREVDDYLTNFRADA